MNFVDVHLGDYSAATFHLTPLEDGIYWRLLRCYYRDECPLPTEVPAVARMVGARTQEEVAAVDVVLSEFFERREDGWHQSRCDAEIQRFRDGEPEREAKKANESNRLRRHRDERASLFRVITDAGHHAAWNAPTSELRELADRLRSVPATAPATAATAPETPATPAAADVHSAQPCETEPAAGPDRKTVHGARSDAPATGHLAPATAASQQPATAPATPATATHYPLPTTHITITTPDGVVKTRKRVATLPDRPEDVPESVWADFVGLRRAKSAPLTATALVGIRREADVAGLSLSDALAMCCARGWQGFRAAWTQEKRANSSGVPEWQQRRDIESRTAALLTGHATSGDTDPPFDFIDLEPAHGKQ